MLFLILYPYYLHLIIIITNIKVAESVNSTRKYNKFAAILTSPLILLDEEKVQIAKDKETLIKTFKSL